jgi:small subunit ribosomal protein S15
MARTHSHRRGKSHSIRPPSRRVPPWVTYSPDELTAFIVKFAKDGLTPSQIGVRLRDEFGVPLVQPIAGKSILQVLAEHGVKAALPEDLERLLRRAQSLQAHLRAHPADHTNVRSLELLEAKVHRLAKYYKAAGRLPHTWKYSAVVAQLT